MSTLYTSIHRQISPCFLQDLQSELKKEQMVKSYKGVKSGRGCEGVTVGALRAVAPAAHTVANLVPAGSNCFLGVSCALLPPHTSAKHR